MTRVFIGVGSNIDAERNVRKALQQLTGMVQVIAISTFYRTPALGRSGMPPFVNGVVEIATTLSPIELKFDVLRHIEETLGRVRGVDKYAPRTIDLDILLFGDTQMHLDECVLPDPEIAKRSFLAAPLSELAAEMVLPGDGRQMQEIAANIDRSLLSPLTALTAELRRIVAEKMEVQGESKSC